MIFNFSWSHISPNLQHGHQKKIGLQNLLLQLMPLLLNFILSHPNGIVALELVLRSKSYSACHWLLKHHQFIIWKKIGWFNPISVLTKNLPQSTAISYPGHTGNLFQFIWYIQNYFRCLSRRLCRSQLQARVSRYQQTGKYQPQDRSYHRRKQDRLGLDSHWLNDHFLKPSCPKVLLEIFITGSHRQHSNNKDIHHHWQNRLCRFERLRPSELVRRQRIPNVLGLFLCGKRWRYRLPSMAQRFVYP